MFKVGNGVRCIICNKDILLTYHRKNRNKNSYCSRNCYSKHRKLLPPHKQNAWKGGLSSRKDYWAKYAKIYRKRKGRHYVQLCNHKRNSLLKDLTLKTIQLVYEDNIKHYGTLTCYLCLKPISFGKDHLEHKIPLSRSGTNKYSNLGISCQRCNNRKHSKTEKEYRVWLKNTKN